MQPSEIVESLAALPMWADVPRSEFEWLVARSTFRTHQVGEVLGAEGEQLDWMSILISGRVALYTPKAGGQRKMVEAIPGSVMGVLPYSRLRRTPGAVIVEQPGTDLAIHRDHFPALVRECPGLTAVLVHHLIDRAREYQSAQLHEDRLQSLGRLASGLAHELNNPASAAVRGARALGAWLDGAERAARDLAAARLTDAQLDVLDAVRSSCADRVLTRTALEAADREDDIVEWLSRHRLDPVLAESLAASGVALAALDRLAATVLDGALAVAIRWVASGCAARQASRQVETSTARIHDLVASIKGFSFMDRAGVPEDVDVARGLTDTLAVLESKSRTRAVGVHLETAADLPRVHGFGSELNQVWEKLIDNAIDAAGPQGRVEVTAAGRGDSVVVRVADNGPGIPEAIRPRLFDPFFTTKPVGQGSGLGLYVARRLVHLHEGDIEFTSQPGRTVFRVRLPLTGASRPPSQSAQ